MAVTPSSNSEPLICKEETMRYRPLGKTGLKISALAMGCMRLSEDQDVNTRIVSMAVDLGVNYFETTRWYCGGQCQHRTAPGLTGKTQGVIVSGKCGIGPDSTAYSFYKEIELQLQILGLTHFKFYQVGWFSWAMMPHLIKRGGVLDAIRRAKDEGLIHHVGFTGHDRPENFTKCIETGLFDCITIPYNLVNRSYEPTINRAGELGVGVIAMCSVAGGVLACDSPKLREALHVDMPSAAMALRFVLSNPNISAACSGMHTMEMLEQNVRTAKEFDPATKGAFQQMCEGLDRLREVLGSKFCTGCSYCQPCPQGVNIPRHMELHRYWQAFALVDGVREALNAMPESWKASHCNECGKCEKACPNGLPIREMLKEVSQLATGRAPRSPRSPRGRKTARPSARGSVRGGR